MYAQFSLMSAPRPWTSTTGRGCAAVGWQDQSLAPGGDDCAPGWGKGGPPAAAAGTAVAAVQAAAAVIQSSRRSMRMGPSPRNLWQGCRPLATHTSSLRVTVLRMADLFDILGGALDIALDMQRGRRERDPYLDEPPLPP